MKVLILGDGLMGQAIHAELPDAFLAGHDAFDIQDYDSITRLLRQTKADVAVNTVAVHRLAECEANASLAFDVNAKGAGRVASLIPTVYLSTDYVWSDGGPHDENMPGRQPRSAYGRSKLAGELETLEHNGIVVRISGVFDERFQSHKGVSFPEMVASTYDDLRLPSDQVFSPTYAKDAAGRIAMLARHLGSGDNLCLPFGKHGDAQYRVQGVYHAANAGSTSWADFARFIQARLGFRRRKIVDFVAKDSLRPTNSALRSTRLMPLPNWMDAVERWLVARQLHIEANRVSPLRGVA